MPKNPFHFNSPTRPEDFVGRCEIVQRIADDLNDLSGDSHAIIGGRRFGKSSLLLALESELAKRLEHKRLGDELVLPVFVSLKSAEFESPSDVLRLALRRIEAATSGTGTHAQLKRPLLDLGLQPRTEMQSLATSLQVVEETLGELVSVAYRTVGRLRIALLLDEVDCVVGYPWTSKLFGLLRSLIYDGPIRDYVRLVLAGSGRFLDVDERGSPLFNAVKAHFLDAFSEDAARELVGRVGNVPREVVSELISQGGGHPFILQYLLHYLFEGGIPSATVESVQAEVRRFVHDRSADLEGWWYAIGDDGRRTYYTMAQTGKWMTHSELSHVAADQSLQIDRALKALCYHGLIVHDGTYQRYRTYGILFQEWAFIRRGTREMSFPDSQKNLDLLKVDSQRSARLGPIVNAIKDGFDREELQMLCFNIGVNYDDLPPGRLEVQALHLVMSCDRSGYLERLIAEIRHLRPRIKL